jgi:hypothetical protein
MTSYTISTANEIAEDIPFMLTQPKRAILSRAPRQMTMSPKKATLDLVGDSKVQLGIYILDSCPVYVTHDTRKAISQQVDREWLQGQLDSFYNKGSTHVELINEKSSLRFAAGGLIHKDACGNYLTIWRDEGAPSYKNHMTLSSGLSGSLREILAPMLVALREGVEEVVFTDNQAIYVPDIANIPFQMASGNKTYLNGIVSRAARDYNAISNTKLPGNLEWTNAELIMESDTSVVVYLNGLEVSRAKGTLNFDPFTAGIDLLGILGWDLDFNKVVARDTERFHYKGSIVPTERRLFIAGESYLKGTGAEPYALQYYQAGKKGSDEVGRAFTPPLAEIVKSL